MFFSKIRLIAVFMFALSTVMLAASSVKAQTVHALLVIMDTDSRFGKGAQVNQRKIEGLLDWVGNVYRVERDVYLSSRSETTPDALLQWLRDVRPASDDVVFVYYSGPGKMVSQRDKRTLLNLTDATLYREDLEEAIEAHTCRLKLIVTDACSNYATHRQQAALERSITITPIDRDAIIQNLFGEHEGLLHVNAARKAQYAWSDTTRSGQGGFFTRSFIAAIDPGLYKDGDGFVEWKEVFEVARKATQEVFRQAENAGSLELALKDPQIDSVQVTLQTPEAYALPRRLNGEPSVVDDPLWEMQNSNPGIAVSMSPNQTQYKAGDYLELTLRAEKDCYITLLNWDSHGNFTKLFPNKYQEDNFIRGGETVHFPPKSAGFRLQLPGPVTKEMLKLIVVNSRSANDAINKALPRASDQAFAQQSTRSTEGDALIVPRIGNVVQTERTIIEVLKGLDPEEWAEVRTSIEVERR